MCKQENIPNPHQNCSTHGYLIGILKQTNKNNLDDQKFFSLPSILGKSIPPQVYSFHLRTWPMQLFNQKQRGISFLIINIQSNSKSFLVYIKNNPKSIFVFSIFTNDILVTTIISHLQMESDHLAFQNNFMPFPRHWIKFKLLNLVHQVWHNLAMPASPTAFLLLLFCSLVSRQSNLYLLDDTRFFLSFFLVRASSLAFLLWSGILQLYFLWLGHFCH